MTAARCRRAWAIGLLSVVGLAAAGAAAACPPAVAAEGQQVSARFESGRSVTYRRHGVFVEATWKDGDRRHVARRWFGLVDRDHFIAAPDDSGTYHRTVLAGDPARALVPAPGRCVQLAGTQEVLRLARLVPLDLSSAQVVGRFALEISIETGPATVFEVGGCRYEGFLVGSTIRAPQAGWQQVSRLSFVPGLGLAIASTVREGRGDGMTEKQDRVLEVLP